jgi:pimeloyl-ACP methyl ester carboxylesterase
MTEPKTYTLEVPGAVLTYDVRSSESTTEPPLLLIGSPMGAAGFGSLSTYFTDRTVVTYDPRGAERSKKSEPNSESTPDQHADDIHRVIAALGKGPVDLFASSGGAVNALALVAKHPEDVRTLIAHEPPAAQVLPDREYVLAANRDIRTTYERSGVGPAMAKFIALVMQRGPIGADYQDRPAPDPAAFGLPAADDGSRNDPLMANMISCTHYEHDFAALRAASTRIVIAAGEESQGEMANRGAYAVAERLGTTPVVFPSNHGGFLGGEYGQMAGKPEQFAMKLREVLSGSRERPATEVTVG